MAWNNLHQEFEGVQEWQFAKGYEETGQGSWPVIASPISSSSESTQINCNVLLQLNVPSIPCSDSYFKSSLAVIASDFPYHAYHTRISIIMFHRTSAVNKFKQLFPAQFCGHMQAQAVMTSNSFTLLLCAMRNKTQGDSTWEVNALTVICSPPKN